MQGKLVDVGALKVGHDERALHLLPLEVRKNELQCQVGTQVEALARGGGGERLDYSRLLDISTLPPISPL